MSFGNVLLLGKEGSGKSTLIQALTSTTCDEKNWHDLHVDGFSLALIDPGHMEIEELTEYRLIHEADRWGKQEGRERARIDVLWFVLSAMDLENAEKILKKLLETTAMWKDIPMLIVLSQSYSTMHEHEQIDYVQTLLKKLDPSGRCKGICAVVSRPWYLNEEVFAPVRNLDRLIEETHALLPKDLKAGDKEICMFLNRQKQIMAQSVVVSFSLAASTLGAVPLPFADAAILTPLEILEINAIARIYGIRAQEETKQAFQTILTVGTISAAARTMISGIKAIPGLNLCTSALNALVAGCVCASLGEGSAYVFSRIATQERSAKDLDWITEVMEGMMSTRVLKRIQDSIKDQGKGDVDQVKKALKDIVQALADLVSLT